MAKAPLAVRHRAQPAYRDWEERIKVRFKRIHPIHLQHNGKRSKGEEQGGGGSKWCWVHLTTSRSDDECKLQNRQANNSNANFAMDLQQHQSIAPAEQSSQGEFLFLVPTATPKAKTINHSTEEPKRAQHVWDILRASLRRTSTDPRSRRFGCLGRPPDD